jgi:uroporphyrinogen decarboxylase
VKESTEELLNSLEDKSKVVFSCGGGMPPGVSSDNLMAFLQTVKTYHLKSL